MRRLGFTLICAALLATLSPVQPAHAEGLTEGNITNAVTSADCQAGTTCGFGMSADFASEDCVEAAVHLGGLRREIHCNFAMSFTIRVEAVVSATGRFLGCAETGGPLGSASFQSGTSSAFNNDNIPIQTADVKAANPNQPSKAVVTFRGEEVEGTNVYTVSGSLTADCGRVDGPIQFATNGFAVVTVGTASQ